MHKALAETDPPVHDDYQYTVTEMSLPYRVLPVKLSQPITIGAHVLHVCTSPINGVRIVVPP